MTSEGLRERSKARRRDAILRSAYRLFAERGFEATTIADIAEAAEVSPRTVTLYFTSKQDMALAHFTAFVDRLAAALRERGPGRTTMDAVEHWLREEIARRGVLDELNNRMLDANPQLRAVGGAHLAQVVEEGARMLAAESGRDTDAFAPRMVAATVAAVVGELMHRPQDADIDAAMAFLRAGVATLNPDPRSAAAS
jgi:AcrR family transcriptional regulator